MKTVSIIGLWFFVIATIVFTNCNKVEQLESVQEEIATVKPFNSKNCLLVGSSDTSIHFDLQLVSNVQEPRPLLPDGQIDSFSYFFLKYHVRTKPLYLRQNFTPTSYHINNYGWDSELVHVVELQCLIENIAAYGCNRDWSFTEAQLNALLASGKTLFQFVTYEKGNGNGWRHLYTDHKKGFFPSVRPTQEYLFANFCWYERAIQAQCGDFYQNPFRFPPRDGVYKLIIEFNPLIKGCRAIPETNYDNNEVTVYLQILNGAVSYSLNENYF